MGDQAPKAIAAPIADQRASAHLGALAQDDGQGYLALAGPTERNESFSGFGKDTLPATMGMDPADTKRTSSKQVVPEESSFHLSI